MAACMTISSSTPLYRKEFYLLRKKGMKGFLKESMKLEDSLAYTVPFTYGHNMFAFSKIINLLQNEYFLLFPAGGKRVNLVHSCFFKRPLWRSQEDLLCLEFSGKEVER